MCLLVYSGRIWNTWTDFRSECKTIFGLKVFLQPSRLSERGPTDFYMWGDLKNPSVFSSIWKWKDSSPTHFLCLSNHTQPPRDLWKGATVHDQTFPCVHWFRWRIFWAFVVNCELINSTNWTVVKLGTCVVNALYQFYVKYYVIKVLTFDCNLPINFRTYGVYMNIFYLPWCEDLTVEVCPSIIDTSFVNVIICKTTYQ